MAEHDRDVTLLRDRAFDCSESELNIDALLDRGLDLHRRMRIAQRAHSRHDDARPSLLPGSCLASIGSVSNGIACRTWQATMYFNVNEFRAIFTSTVSGRQQASKVVGVNIPPLVSERVEIERIACRFVHVLPVEKYGYPLRFHCI